VSDNLPPLPDSPASDLNAIANALVAYANAATWDAAETIVDSHQAVLLHPIADTIFEQFIHDAPPNMDERVITHLRNRQTVLRWSRELGIEAAFERARVEFEHAAPPTASNEEVQAIADAIIGFINTDDWDAARAFVEVHATHLLHPLADAIFDEMLAAQTDDKIIRTLRTHQAVLQLCRDLGIEAAFRRVQEVTTQEKSTAPTDADDTEDENARFMHRLAVLFQSLGEQALITMLRQAGMPAGEIADLVARFRGHNGLEE
jgi:hypothetical protein